MKPEEIKQEEDRLLRFIATAEKDILICQERKKKYIKELIALKQIKPEVEK